MQRTVWTWKRFSSCWICIWSSASKPFQVSFKFIFSFILPLLPFFFYLLLSANALPHFLLAFLLPSAIIVYAVGEQTSWSKPVCSRGMCRQISCMLVVWTGETLDKQMRWMSYPWWEIWPFLGHKSSSNNLVFMFFWVITRFFPEPLTFKYTFLVS